MRAKTKKKHGMGRRFAILIGVAAGGVIALGAQTASSTTGDPVDSTPPDLQLSGPKKQNPQRDRICDRPSCNVIVQLDVDEACTVRAWGKLTNVKMDKLAPDGPWRFPEDFSGPSGIQWGKVKMGPELAKEKQRREVREALANGENVKAKVTVKATDAAGNVATAKRTITLVK
jgi:hypothetical protein